MIAVIKAMEALPVSEKIIVVEALWDSIARNNPDLPVHDWQKSELAVRKRNYSRTRQSAMKKLVRRRGASVDGKKANGVTEPAHCESASDADSSAHQCGSACK